MLTKQQELYIASRGDHLEELIAEADPPIIAGLISKGLATEHYDEWKTSEHPEIQHAFAVTDLEYCKQLLALNSLDHWNFVCNQIDETTNTDCIKIVLEAPVPNGIDQRKLQAIRIMYKAKTSQPSPIEKTMSLSQLFQSQSPFWANNLTLNRIESILDLYDTIKSDIFFENLKKLIELDEDHAYLSIWNLKFDHRKELKQWT
jgi:hypothetical protein